MALDFLQSECRIRTSRNSDGRCLSDFVLTSVICKLYDQCLESIFRMPLVLGSTPGRILSSQYSIYFRALDCIRLHSSARLRLLDA